MKKLIVLIIALLAISVTTIAQDTIIYPDTSMTKLKKNLVLVEIATDSTTSNDFLFSKKEVNAKLARARQTRIELKEQIDYLMEIKAKMEEESGVI